MRLARAAWFTKGWRSDNNHSDQAMLKTSKGWTLYTFQTRVSTLVLSAKGLDRNRKQCRQRRRRRTPAARQAASSHAIDYAKKLSKYK